MKDMPSKLDAFSERLDEWFGIEKKTLKAVQEQLRLDGCVVSLSRLSDWWSKRQQRNQEQMLLAQIANGARACKEVELSLEKHGGVELETLIKLQRVLILKFSTEGNVDAEKLELVQRMLREVQKFARLQQLNRQISLERDKFEFDAATACLKVLPDLKEISANNKLSQTEKVQAIRLKLFGVLPDQQT